MSGTRSGQESQSSHADRTIQSEHELETDCSQGEPEASYQEDDEPNTERVEPISDADRSESMNENNRDSIRPDREAPLPRVQTREFDGFFIKIEYEPGKKGWLCLRCNLEIRSHAYNRARGHGQSCHKMAPEDQE